MQSKHDTPVTRVRVQAERERDEARADIARAAAAVDAFHAEGDTLTETVQVLRDAHEHVKADLGRLRAIEAAAVAFLDADDEDHGGSDSRHARAALRAALGAAGGG